LRLWRRLRRCQDCAVADLDITPEEASRGRTVRDADLPMLAAMWLTRGFDSPLLRELAGLTRYQATEARRMFEAVLAELGHPVVPIRFPYDELPWRGYWDQIRWSVEQMDTTHSPYASAQRVLEVLGDVAGLWEPGGGRQLMTLLERWDADPERRNELTERIRAHLRSLREGDVPPLI
jgi:hypothetical protein